MDLKDIKLKIRKGDVPLYRDRKEILRAAKTLFTQGPSRFHAVDKHTKMAVLTVFAFVAVLFIILFAS